MRAFAITGNRDRLLDLADLVGIRHARDAALRPDVGGDALERHDRARARVLRDPRLLGRRDVHDHAALEHLGQARLDAKRSDLHRGQSSPNGSSR